VLLYFLFTLSVAGLGITLFYTAEANMHVAMLALTLTYWCTGVFCAVWLSAYIVPATLRAHENKLVAHTSGGLVYRHDAQAQFLQAAGAAPNHRDFAMSYLAKSVFMDEFRRDRSIRDGMRRRFVSVFMWLGILTYCPIFTQAQWVQLLCIVYRLDYATIIHFYSTGNASRRTAEKLRAFPHAYRRLVLQPLKAASKHSVASHHERQLVAVCAHAFYDRTYTSQLLEFAGQKSDLEAGDRLIDSFSQ